VERVRGQGGCRPFPCWTGVLAANTLWMGITLYALSLVGLACLLLTLYGWELLRDAAQPQKHSV